MMFKGIIKAVLNTDTLRFVLPAASLLLLYNVACRSSNYERENYGGYENYGDYEPAMTTPNVRKTDVGEKKVSNNHG